MFHRSWHRKAEGAAAGPASGRRPRPLALEALEDRTVLSFVVQSPFSSAGVNPAGVAAADLFRHNQPDLAVTNNNNGGPNGSVTIYRNTTASQAGDITFAQAQDIPVGKEPIGVVAAPLTSSGLNDLVVANNGDGDGTIAVLLNDPNSPGTYLPPVYYSVGGNPFTVAVGQFTASGNQDIVVGTGTSTVSLLLGNGDGTFQPPIQIDTGGAGGGGVAVGRFTPGGNYNIVVANNTTNNVSVLLGNGDGTFQPPVLYPVGVQPTTVAIGDVSNDGFADIVVANQDPDNPDGGSVTVLLNDGTDNFPTRNDYAAGGSPTAVVLGNFRGDDRGDIAVSNFLVFGGGVSVLLNNGDGTFGAATKFPTGGLTAGIAVADFNGDGFLDMAVANAFSNTISILRNDGMPKAPSPGGSADAGAVRPAPVRSTTARPAAIHPVFRLSGGRVEGADEVGLRLQSSAARKAEVSALFSYFETEGSAFGDRIDW